jgi:predicted peptidase
MVMRDTSTAPLFPKGAAVILRNTLAAVATAAGLVVVPAAAGEKSDHGFLPRVFKANDGDAKYVLFVPHAYKGDKEYPLILFLHGAGERGDDGERPVQQGIGNAIKFKGGESKFPFFVIFPQCRAKGTWKADGADAQRALGILDEVAKTYKIDRKRIYLTGLSLGGYGTWSLAAAYPERWAAIAPVCGGGDPKMADKIKHIPCWCFHGDGDKAVPVQRSRDMIDALKKAGGEPRYSEFPYVGHNSWDPAYVTGELYPWLLKQSLK